jgi:hypothetical protein
VTLASDHHRIAPGRPPTISSALWHATVRPSIRRSFGTSARHRSIAYGHLGWNGHPGGGFAGSGTVPGSTILDRRAARSISGTAERRASV